MSHFNSGICYSSSTFHPNYDLKVKENDKIPTIRCFAIIVFPDSTTNSYNRVDKIKITADYTKIM